LEGRNARFCMDLIRRAKHQGAKVILSWHDFGRTPSMAVLRDKIQSLFRRGADVAKIATRAETDGDVERLRVALKGWGAPVAAMGMGPKAVGSRLVLALAGSVLVYGFYDKPAAPGQVSVRELRRRLALYQCRR